MIHSWIGRTEKCLRKQFKFFENHRMMCMDDYHTILQYHTVLSPKTEKKSTTMMEPDIHCAKRLRQKMDRTIALVIKFYSVFLT